MTTTNFRSSTAARLALVGSLTVGGVMLAPAADAATRSAVCTASFPINLTPGLGMAESTFRYSSNGQAGTVTCVGWIQGHRVTGPGTVWDEGVARGSCNGGTVEGFHVYKIPTENGILTFQRPVSGTYQGVAGIRDPQRSYPGGFAFYPTTGDCVTAPATRADVVAYGFLLA